MISLVFIALFVPSFIAINSFTGALQSHVIDQLEIDAVHTMDKISRVMFERISDITTIVNDPFEASPETLDKKLNEFREVEKAHKVYTSISLYDKNGIKIGDTRNFKIGIDESNEPFFKHAIRGEIYYDETPVFSKSLNQHVIHFSGPLYDNGTTNGVLVTRFPINKINDILNEAGGNFPKDLEIDLLSNDGLIIFSNHRKGAVLKENLQYSPIFKKIKNSNKFEESFVGINDEPEEKLNVAVREKGFLDYKGNGWILMISTDAEDAFKDVNSLRTNFLIIALIILVVSMALIFFFSRSISKPIKKLTKVIEDISTGKLDTKVDYKLMESKDEIGILARAFDRTIVSLKLAMKKAGKK